MLRLFFFCLAATWVIGLMLPSRIAFPKGEPVRVTTPSEAPHDTELQREANGHFYVHAKVNGQLVRFVVDTGATVVALTREGTGWASGELARQVERWRIASRPMVLMLGGSSGLDASLLAAAQFRWSLSPLTLPHELARVVVLEQLYRAFTILRGEPYDKGGER